MIAWYTLGVARPKPSKMSYAEYVAAEEKSDVRHEFLDGEVCAMAGGTPEHSALAAAVIGELRTALSGKPCRVFTADLRLRIGKTGLTTYGDIVVVCGSLETAKDDSNAVTNPTLIVEVLSDSTESYDRGAKAAHYRRIPSLKEYVLVGQKEPLVEVYRRNERGRWELAVEVGRGERAELDSVGVVLAVDSLYANPLA